MPPLSTHEAVILIVRVGCSYDVAEFTRWAFEHRDQSLIAESRGYFLRAGGTEREWGKIVDAFHDLVPA